MTTETTSQAWVVFETADSANRSYHGSPRSAVDEFARRSARGTENSNEHTRRAAEIVESFDGVKLSEDSASSYGWERGHEIADIHHFAEEITLRPMLEDSDAVVSDLVEALREFCEEGASALRLLKFCEDNT